MRFFSVSAALFIISLGFSACGPQLVESEKLQVWVTIQPQKTFVEAVAGDHAEVSVMVRSGESPETYSPGVPQMVALAQADIYFGIGMPLERRILERIERSMPQLDFVQTTEILEHAHDGHDREENGSCVFGDVDPHVWMDPLWMVGFVKQVEAALVAARPELTGQFSANATGLSRKLQNLDAALREQLAPYEGHAFYINHPSLGHFARRYGLVQRSLEQGGSAPSVRQVAKLVETAKADQVRTVFSQPEFGRSRADILAQALSVDVIQIDVLSADYFNNMREIGDRLEASFDK
jgi:zinc transport system substrate-binding protein